MKPLSTSFEAIIGFGRRYMDKPTKYKSGKVFHRWQTTKFEHTQALIALLWPWLGDRRRARAKEILAAARVNTHHGAQTHCKRGHEFTEENTYRWPKAPGQSRQCKMCHQRRSRA